MEMILVRISLEVYLFAVGVGGGILYLHILIKYSELCGECVRVCAHEEIHWLVGFIVFVLGLCDSK